MTPPRRQYLADVGYWLLAWTVPLCIGIGYGAGWWLDERFNTTPWLQVAGFLIGSAAGLAQIMQAANSKNDRK